MTSRSYGTLFHRLIRQPKAIHPMVYDRPEVIAPRPKSIQSTDRKNMRPNVDSQKIEHLMQVLGQEAQGSGSIYFTGGASALLNRHYR